MVKLFRVFSVTSGLRFCFVVSSECCDCVISLKVVVEIVVEVELDIDVVLVVVVFAQ